MGKKKETPVEETPAVTSEASDKPTMKQLFQDFNQQRKDFEFPCRMLGYCPYGPLVERFPILEQRDNKSCPAFGHNCPVFYVAEPFTAQAWEGK